MTKYRSSIKLQLAAAQQSLVLWQKNAEDWREIAEMYMIKLKGAETTIKQLETVVKQYQTAMGNSYHSDESMDVK